jgi:putative heme-binding domain-containing protein
MCHDVGGDRSRPGPNLAGLADRMDRDRIIVAVVDPSREFAVGYRGVTIFTTDGQILRGYLWQIAAERVSYLDKQGRTGFVPAARIAELMIDEISEMWEGQTDELTDQEFANLIAYLGSLRM